MIYICPHCGHSLAETLKDGIAHCQHCDRVFDSGVFNRLLSAGWLVRRHRQTIEQLQQQMGVPEHEAIIVHCLVADNGYTHEELLKALSLLGMPQKTTIRII